MNIHVRWGSPLGSSSAFPRSGVIPRTTHRRAYLPKRRVSHPVVIALTIALTALSTAASSSDSPVSTAATATRMLQVDPDWDLLLPPNHGAQRPELPAPIHNYLGEGAPAATQRGSAAVNLNLDGRMVRIPGFIVPLDEDSEGRVTDFFLVPYVGACIHVPPPPPNQIVYVKPKTPFFVHGLGDAYWITGRMHVEVRNTAMATASYSIVADTVDPYVYTRR
jgi:hypothetical protein